MLKSSNKHDRLIPGPYLLVIHDYPLISSHAV